VAIEFDWYGDADVDTATLRALVTAMTNGEQGPDGTVFLDGMYVMGRAVSGEDVNPAIALFGFAGRFSMTFRFANLADAPAAERNTALMVHVLIAFAQRYGGSGVLLFNGDEAVLQYGEGGVTFAADWEDWTENAEVAPLVAQFGSRVLPQPLL
jgi:hypothetical protein